MRIGNKDFEIEKHIHTYVMGILNVTPDSFSDGGKYNQIDQALRHVEKMIEDGMDILDLGGESTRPGYIQLTVQEEIDRIIPVVKAIKARFDIPLSLDTYKSEVAKAGIDEGIDLINDIWGLKYDENMAKVIADSKLPCCLMHNRKDMNYGSFLQDIAADLSWTIQKAENAGIEDSKIILDPGVGFAKTYEQNLQIINSLESLHVFGYPLLLGTSKKSVIGLTLELPVEERMEGTIVTSVLAVMKKCAFVRVHDVKENVRAIKMTEAILNA